MTKRFIFALLGVAAALALPMAASATGTAGGGGALNINGVDVPLEGCQPTGKGSEQACQGSSATESYNLTNYSFSFDPDPNVVLFFAIQNTLVTEQTFTMTAVVPVTPVGPGLIINGSIAGSVTDANQNGATLADATGAPLYAAIIDGAPLRTLLDAPQSFTTDSSATIGPAAFGPEVFAGSAATFIALQIQFTLSPGDVASFTSVFNVVPVPEPGTMMLLASGIAGIAAWGRRRSG